jgi:hypothetical protein
VSANVPESRPKKESIAKQPGDRVRLTDGRVAEVVTNPMDGVWLIVRAVDDAGVDDEMVLLTDIAGPG